MPPPCTTPLWDSKIVWLESWLCKPRKEIRLGGLSTQRGAAIRDSSPQAESFLEKVDSKLKSTKT
ncbi:hypothetical protein NYG90_05370 [Helicobacter sp. XJK30-2]|uniref:Uncharacterized protein n=1 Tax=Helicobacter zhangjianzhongii TaxID=2974574 RepID=A0ACC6FS49_9HELI|nr:hypothetical protein [Helicobacter sp. XJK30-2]MDL0082104.1 hypothetical protein [Helicobacter sp. XJK30-2]